MKSRKHSTTVENHWFTNDMVVRNGRTSIEDDERLCRDSVILSSITALVRDLFDINRRLTVQGMAEEFGHSPTTVTITHSRIAKVLERSYCGLIPDEDRFRSAYSSEEKCWMGHVYFLCGS